MTESDLIIIGAGPGGYELAARRAGAGDRVVIIEDREVGGTCLNRGCIPTKCLCRSAEVLRTVREAENFGVNTGEVTVDYSKAVARMKAVVDGLRQGVESLLANCEVVRGRGVITPSGTVRVDDREFTAPKIIIATGSRPAMLPVPGAELAVTSDELLSADTLPGSLAIIGGGVIGLEFASIMNEFGVNVTVIEFCKEILPQFDKDIAKRLRSLLSRRGVTFVTGSAVTGIAESENGLTVTYDSKKGSQILEVESVLMAVGRRPVVPDGLEAAGIEVSSRGFIVTDENMMTTRPGVFAVGDCNGRLMLAHAASAQAEKIFVPSVNLEVIPSAVFTVPEVAMVGKTAEQLDAEGVTYKTSKSLFASNGKAQALGEPDGFVKVLYDPDSRRMLGCHIIGPHAADLIHEAAIVMATGLTIDDLGRKTVHGHPTLGETLMSACHV